MLNESTFHKVDSADKLTEENARFLGQIPTYMKPDSSHGFTKRVTLQFMKRIKTGYKRKAKTFKFS